LRRNENLEWENEISAATTDLTTDRMGLEHWCTGIEELGCNTENGDQTAKRVREPNSGGVKKNLCTKEHEQSRPKPEVVIQISQHQIKKGKMNSTHEIQKPTPKTKITHLLHRN
jgi:hypothetical protein